MDLFVIGNDDAVWSTFWRADRGWVPWFQIHPESAFDHATQTVMPMARRSDQLDLFVIGNDNAVWSTFWRADRGWVPWFQIRPEIVFDHATQSVIPGSRESAQVDLFVLGNDDVVWSTWWRAPDEGGWLDDIGNFFEGAWDLVTSAAGGLIDTLDGVFGGVLDALAGVLGLFCSIPYVGRVICTIWDLLLNGFYILLSALDFILGLLGFLPEKRLRLCIIVQLDQNG